MCKTEYIDSAVYIRLIIKVQINVKSCYRRMAIQSLSSALFMVRADCMR